MSTHIDIPGRRQAVRLTLGWAGRLAGGLAGLVAGALIMALAAVCVLMALGHRPMIERSDSMAPVMRAGDVLFVKTIEAADARPGDVVTFRDPRGADRTITHRVVSVKPSGSELAFVTRGDANTGVERWKAAPAGPVGRYAFRIPTVGRWVHHARGDAWRALVVLAATALTLDVLRRLWRSTPPPPPVPTGTPTSRG